MSQLTKFIDNNALFLQNATFDTILQLTVEAFPQFTDASAMSFATAVHYNLLAQKAGISNQQLAKISKFLLEIGALTNIEQNTKLILKTINLIKSFEEEK